MKEKIIEKIRSVYPALSPEAIENYAKRLMNAEEFLIQNLKEWLEEKDFTDIFVKDKYCLNMVMELNDTNDFITAFTALDNYAKDDSAESGIWMVRI